MRPPWVYCEIESKELLSICLKKLRGLNKVKLMDAAFRWTEEHSKRIRVELTIRKEVNTGIFLEQTFEVEYVVNWVQCDDCKKDFTPHTWVSCVQIRQRAEHKKTFLYLEQLMLKLGIANKALKIAEEPDGLDFFFRSKQNALQVVSYIQSLVPYTQKDSKELVSADIHTGTADYKYSHILEIPKICREDLVILPKPLAKELGGVNALGVCYRVGLVIHCYDPVTLRLYEINSKQYWCYHQDLIVVPFRGQETEFMITDIQEDHAKASMLNTTFSNIQTRFARVDV
jgi:nonsense-mediated mRNA decay protein 3